MKITISDHMHDTSFILEGDAGSVKRQIVARFPYFAEAAEHLSISQLVEEIDRHPYYFAELEASPEEMNDMLSEEADDEPEEESEPKQRFPIPLPRGLREFVSFGDDEDS